MKLLSRLTLAASALVFPVVALTGTAYAKLPPEDPDWSGPVPATGEPVVETIGLPTWQVITLVLIAAVVTAVLTVIATRRMPRSHPPYAKSAA